VTTPAVRFENITRRFPGVVALDRVSFEVESGEVHAICGENGAGKSTLGRILAGIHTPDAGQVCLDGRAVRFTGPRDALAARVAMVHQELAFCDNLTVAENLCLARLPSRWSFVARGELHRRAVQLLADVGATGIAPDRPLSSLGIAGQQVVQIAAAVGSGARIVVFDEPTSSLGEAEAGRLYRLIGALRERGITQLYVSHRMAEIFRLCDRVTVLRDGRHVCTKRVAEIDEGTLVHEMIGRRIEQYFPAHVQTGVGDQLLRVENLSSPGKFRGVSLSLHAGEVVGLAGLVGAGRSEVANAIFGLDADATGTVTVRGRRVRIRSPRRAMALGIGYVPEDRKRQGLVLSLAARKNVTLPTLASVARFGWVNTRRERDLAARYTGPLRLRAATLDAPAVELSGGNQQKLVLAKWLAARSEVLILDEPTRGVDVGAKAELHAWVDRLASDGAGVLLISSELPELLNLSTRILVMRGGRIVGDLARGEATQDRLLRLMAGLGRADVAAQGVEPALDR
jgi:ribose transport system ATP-binding protein